MMGTGKTTVARILSGMLGCEMRDTDRMVEESQGRSVREIFAEMGEDAFRDIEASHFEEAVSGGERRVVAGAGGVVLRESNRALLNELRREGKAFVVWLVADVESLVERTSRGGHRPLIDDNPESSLSRIAAEREPKYAGVADLRLDTSTVGARRAAEIIAETLAEIDAWPGGKNA